MKWFSAFWYWLFGLVFTDSPSTPFSQGEFDEQISKPTPFDSFCSRPLAALLWYGEPELLNRWYHVVLSAAYKYRAEEQEYQRLLNQKEETEAELGSLKGSLESALGEDSASANSTNNYQLALSLGLAFMLFLGISEYMGIEIQSITADKYLLVGLALAAAVSLTLKAKTELVKFVKASRSNEPKRSFHDDERHKNTVPFWERISQGDAAVWLSIAIVLFEMFFAAPGLLSLLPPKLQAQPLFLLSAFVAAGLAALVNVISAWGTALYDIHLAQEREERHYDPRQQAIAERNRERHQGTERAQARLRVINERIKEQKRKVSDAKERARLEHERWEYAVRRWFRSNPDKVKNFQEQYPQWQQSMQYGQASLNGGANLQGNNLSLNQDEQVGN